MTNLDHLEVDQYPWCSSGNLGKSKNEWTDIDIWFAHLKFVIYFISIYMCFETSLLHRLTLCMWYLAKKADLYMQIWTKYGQKTLFQLGGGGVCMYLRVGSETLHYNQFQWIL